MLRTVALRGVGDDSKERLFRMNVTLCMHRACTEAEVAGLPAWWHEALSGMAGGPVEVLWSKNVTDSPSSAPCENPEHVPSMCGRPDLWIPCDCGQCAPCKARAQIACSVRLA